MIKTLEGHIHYAKFVLIMFIGISLNLTSNNGISYDNMDELLCYIATILLSFYIPLLTLSPTTKKDKIFLTIGLLGFFTCILFYDIWSLILVTTTIVLTLIYSLYKYKDITLSQSDNSDYLHWKVLFSAKKRYLGLLAILTIFTILYALKYIYLTPIRIFE